jgi:hypothetical protein
VTRPRNKHPQTTKIKLAQAVEVVCVAAWM